MKERLAPGPATAASPRGAVVLHASDGHNFAHSHEWITRTEIARRLAALKGFDFVGEHDPSGRYPGGVYLVPGDTLAADAARKLGVSSDHDLFGGVVPFPFVATKAITHPLVEHDAAAPAGWSHEFGSAIRDVAHRGYSVFTAEDAHRAAARLLELGPLRIKPVRATGGRGQTVIYEAAALQPALHGLDPAELSQYGLVLEENLTGVTTYSVGQVRVADLLATYCGTQRLTSDNGGATVYGGSDLLVVPGGFGDLLAVDLPEQARIAVMQARVYDNAANALYPGLFASRRNYDVARGRNAANRWSSGVLEQSWRIGGASSAEIAALEVFQKQPAATAIRASSVEVYGSSEPPPSHVTVYFCGVDEHDGPLTKYALAEACDDAG